MRTRMSCGIIRSIVSSITTDDVAVQEDKVRENRLRRMAERQGLVLRKSRRRDPRALDYGGYWLMEPKRRAVQVGGEYGVNLDDIERYLTGEDEDDG